MDNRSVSLKELRLTKEQLFWILNISGWILFGILMRLYNPAKELPALKNVILYSLTYLIGFLMSLGLRAIYRKVYTKTHSFVIILGIIILASFIFIVFWEPIDILVSLPFWEPGRLQEFLQSYSPFRLYTYYRLNLMWYLFILIWSILYFGIRNWFAQTDQRIKAEKAMAQANQAQLMMLRYQLNPHFLFNSLNSIQGLMYQDVKKADLMLTELSEFVRYTLNFNNMVYIPLKQEFEIIQKFLFVEKIRFEDRLDYSIELPAALENEKILCFLIQPFVENAVKHGIRNNPYRRIRISVKASSEKEWLVVEVSNTGQWVSRDDNQGMGIANTRERLDNAYPKSYLLNIIKGEDQVTVQIKVPHNENV